MCSSVSSTFQTGFNSDCTRASKRIPGNVQHSVAAQKNTGLDAPCKASKTNEEKHSKKNVEKNNTIVGAMSVRDRCCSLSRFHRLPGDLATREERRNASKRDVSIHKPEEPHVFMAFLPTAAECL